MKPAASLAARLPTKNGQLRLRFRAAEYGPVDVLLRGLTITPLEEVSPYKSVDGASAYTPPSVPPAGTFGRFHPSCFGTGLRSLAPNVAASDGAVGFCESRIPASPLRLASFSVSMRYVASSRFFL